MSYAFNIRLEYVFFRELFIRKALFILKNYEAVSSDGLMGLNDAATTFGIAIMHLSEPTGESA